ncbi:hypothetical protein GCK32_008025, partial [Trichostrongylus colubriformis]
MLCVLVLFMVVIGTGGALAASSNKTLYRGVLSVPASADASYLKRYRDYEEVYGSVIVENTTKLERFVMLHLRNISCTATPCVKFRNNTKLKSIWLPNLKYMDYKNMPEDA